MQRPQGRTDPRSHLVLPSDPEDGLGLRNYHAASTCAAVEEQLEHLSGCCLRWVQTTSVAATTSVDLRGRDAKRSERCCGSSGSGSAAQPGERKQSGEARCSSCAGEGASVGPSHKAEDRLPSGCRCRGNKPAQRGESERNREASETAPKNHVRRSNSGKQTGNSSS